MAGSELALLFLKLGDTPGAILHLLIIHPPLDSQAHLERQAQEQGGMEARVPLMVAMTLLAIFSRDLLRGPLFRHPRSQTSDHHPLLMFTLPAKRKAPEGVRVVRIPKIGFCPEERERAE